MNFIFKLNPLASIAIAYTATGVLQKGIGFALFMWFAYTLSAANYAYFGLLMAMQTAVATLAAAGIVEAVIGGLKDHKSDAARRDLYRCANASFLMLGLGAALLAYAVSIVFMGARNWSISDLSVVIVGGILVAFFSMQSSIVRLDEKHQLSISLNFLPPLIGFVAGFATFSLRHEVTSFFTGMMIGLLLSLFALKAFHPLVLELPARIGPSIAFTVGLGPFILICALGWASGYGSTYVVDAFYDPAQVAKFTFAYSLSSIMHLVATSLNQVWSPKFFSRVHRLPLIEVEGQNKRFYLYQGCVLGTVGLIVLIVIPILTKSIGGHLKTYSDITSELFLLFAGYALCIPWYHSQNYFLAHGRGVELMKVTIGASLLGFMFLALSIWQFGAIGVYIGFLGQLAGKSAIAMLWARRIWKINVPWEGTLIALLLLSAGALLPRL